MAQITGIDVSQFQGVIDWDALKANGVKFAIIRAGYGGGGRDSQFTRNWSEAKRVGIIRQAYHFAYPGRSTGSQQAREFMNIVGKLDAGDSLSLDMEDEIVYGRMLVPSDVDWAKEFLETCRGITDGVNPLLYLNSSLKGRFDWSPISKANYGLWIANYGSNSGQPSSQSPDPAPWPFWAIWQYTSKGSVGGLSPLDMDIFSGDEAALRKYGSATGVTPSPQPTPAPIPQPVVPIANNTYIVKSGDNLSSIAAKYNTTWQALAAANGLSNPNLIYPGQVLRVPGTAAPKTYVVKSGDTLSSIAAANGTTWQRLAQLNGLPNPNLIYPGQVLKLG